MPKRYRLQDARSTDREGRASQGTAPASPAPSAGRPWLWVIGAVVAMAAAGWWGFRAWRGSTGRDAVASLQPMAPRVPADQPERREVVEVADGLLRDYPDSPEALYARGVILSRYGFNDEAVKTWEACLELVPNLAPAYERLGIEAFQRGDTDKAVEMLRKAVQADPDSPAAGLYLGESLNNLGRMKEAIPVLERFLKVSPRTPEPYFQLAQAWAYLKDYRRARDYHAAALKEDPEFTQACYGLAVAWERLGEADQARQYREKYAAMIAQSRVAENRRVRQHRDEAELRESLAGAYLTAAKLYAAHGRASEAEEFGRRAALLKGPGKKTR